MRDLTGKLSLDLAPDLKDGRRGQWKNSPEQGQR